MIKFTEIFAQPRFERTRISIFKSIHISRFIDHTFAFVINISQIIRVIFAFFELRVSTESILLTRSRESTHEYAIAISCKFHASAASVTPGFTVNWSISHIRDINVPQEKCYRNDLISPKIIVHTRES